MKPFSRSVTQGPFKLSPSTFLGGSFLVKKCAVCVLGGGGYSQNLSVSLLAELVAVPHEPAVRAACVVLRWTESVRTGDCCRCSSALSCNAATPDSLFSLSEASCGCSCFTFLDTFFYFHLSILQVIFLLLVCPDRTPFFCFCVLTAVMHIPWEKTPQQKNIEKHCSNVVSLLLSDRSSLKDAKEDRGRALMWQEVQARRTAGKPNTT